MGSFAQPQFCSECGRSVPATELARFGSSAVCIDCKPAFAQRIREGATTNPSMAPHLIYGGFWIRFVATLLDGLIVGAALLLVSALVMIPVGIARKSFFSDADPSNFVAFFALFVLALIPLQIPYYVYFLSQKGATPGKMAMGLKVITASGGPISVGRAFGRFFANLLNGFVPFYIGYIIAAFDAEKRALHDHICSTRVVKT